MRPKLSLLLIFVFFAPFSSVAIADSKLTTSILFVFHDAGETLALKPVLEELDKKNIDYKIFLLGKAAKELLSAHQNSVDLINACHLHATSQPLLDKPFDDITRLKLANCVDSKLIISGLVSIKQKQLLQLWRRKGNTIGYVDGFSLDLTQKKIELLSLPTTLWLPSHFQKRDLNAVIDSPTIVIGQPSLHHWKKALPLINKKATQKKLNLSTPDNVDTILYAGTYGPYYEKSFELFVKGIKKRPNTIALVSLHPGKSGTVEHRVIKAEEAEKKVFIIPKEINTLEAAALSDVIVSQDSSVTIQAFFANIPSLFLDATPKPFQSFFVSHQLIQRTDNENDFLKMLSQALSSHHTVNERSPFLEAKIPEDSKTLMLKEIEKKLNVDTESNQHQQRLLVP